MQELINRFLEIPLEYLVLIGILFLLVLITLISLSNTNKKLKKLKNKYNKFMNGLSDRNIEELLNMCIEDVNQVKQKNSDIELKINHIDRLLIQCIQKVGVVRFNAFDNVGSDLSFAIALLDNNDTGVVVSGIYARDSSSTYAKPVSKGKSNYPLSAEEIQAIDIAKKSNVERNYKEKIYVPED